MSGVLMASGLSSGSTDITEGPFKTQVFEGTEEKRRLACAKQWIFIAAF